MGSVSYLLHLFMLRLDNYNLSKRGFESGAYDVVSKFFLAIRLIKLRIYDYFIIYRLLLKINTLNPN
jgi:hypothetical protein